ncbi:hypothetical protein PQX77_001655 [Marasmius sp. AFHP31]|nr:hypothetical protein PQX77_001655 [Marasmius sp. AFHP31]
MSEIHQRILSDAQISTINGSLQNVGGSQFNNNYHAPTMSFRGRNISVYLPPESATPSVEPERAGLQSFKHNRSMPRSETKMISALIDETDLSGNYSVCWIHGSIGCGKTAVALTLVERKEDAASFILGRGDDPRPGGICASLARELERVMPGIEELYKAALDRLRGNEESLASNLPQTPFRVLVDAAKAWRSLHRSNSIISLFARIGFGESKKQESFLIVLDGLEQISPTDYHTSLEILLDSVADGKSPLRFVICTRSDPFLGKTFLGHQSVRHIDLDESLAPHVPQYLRLEMKNIRDRYDLPEDWPSQDDQQALEQLADGQLGCASGILKYIGNVGGDGGSSHSPDTRMKMVLGQVDKDDSYISPTAPLDHAYMETLTYLSNRTRDKLVGRILPSICCLQRARESSTRDFIDTLHGLPKGSRGLDISTLMHSMLHIPSRKLPENDILILKRSCIDFFGDRQRSKQFFIDPQESHFDVAQLWFERLTGIKLEELDEGSKAILTLWNRWAHFCVAYPGVPSQKIIASCGALDLKALYDVALSCLLSGKRGLFSPPFLGVQTLVTWFEEHAAVEGVQPLLDHFKSAQTNIYVSISRSDDTPVAGRHTELKECFADIFVLGMAGCRHECTWTNALVSRARGCFGSEFNIKVVAVGSHSFDGDSYPRHIKIEKETFVRVARSLLEADASAIPENFGYFLNVLGSSLLSLCGENVELLPKCRRLTRELFHSKIPEDHRDEVVGCLGNVRKWLELFPQSDVNVRDFLDEVDKMIAQGSSAALWQPRQEPPLFVPKVFLRTLGLEKGTFWCPDTFISRTSQPDQFRLMFEDNKRIHRPKISNCRGDL